MRYIFPVLLFIAGVDIMNRLYVPLPNDGDPAVLGWLLVAMSALWLGALILFRKKRDTVANPPKG